MELTDYRFFQGLETASARKILDEAKTVRLGTGTFLYYEGEVSGGILFLARGKVKVFVHSDEIGRGEITLYYLTPGEQCLVNTFSTVTQTPASASAIVDESIEGWLVPARTVRWLIDHSPAFREYKIDFCASRVHHLIHLIGELRFKRMDERLLNWLYVQGRETIHVTHEQIASILGTSREVVSRLLKNFEKQGIVRLGRGVVQIVSG